MILASHQPDFFPYMGYFYKVFQSDVFVFSDNVQFSKSGRHNYNEILTCNGPHRFTLPVSQRVANLNEIQIAADDHRISTMLKTLWMEYKKAPAFHEAFPVVEELLMGAPDSENLAAFNHTCITTLCRHFGLHPEFHLSSELDLKSRRDDRIIEMCKLLGADVYYSGDGAKDYHVEANYVENGIRLVYSDYQPADYPQVGRPATVNMSVIDYVMNCGFVLPRGWEKWKV